MPQTILAILALMLATLFAHQQQRGYVRTQMNMVRNELALQGTGVAEEVLGEIGGTAFDEATIDGTAEEGELTDLSDFGPEANPDIDDFHGQTLERTRTFRGNTLRFEVQVEVTYVDEDDLETESLSETKAKRATVTVYSKDIGQPVRIRVSRSYTCRSECNWE